jgi:hypothetical protein
MIEAKDKSDIIHELKIAMGWDASEGASFKYENVQGTKTKVYTKYFTGNLAAAATTNVAHGVSDIDKIMHVSAMAWDDVVVEYVVYDFAAALSGNDAFYLQFDATNINFKAVGANLQGNKYRIKIEYYK